MDCRIFYQSLVLVAFYRFGLCQQFLYDLPVKSAYTNIDGSEKRWEAVHISKYKFSDKFVFSPEELNDLFGGVFVSRNVEILELIDRDMSFAIVRPRLNFPLYIRVIFKYKKDVQTFFRDIRALKKRQYGEGINVDRIFQYPKENLRNNIVTSLILLAHGNSFYVKQLNPPELFDNSKSFNFLHIQSSRVETADLILQPQTFNISPKLGRDKYVLCLNNVEKYFYVVLFPDESSADAFSASVTPHVNRRIPCNYDWITPRHLQQIDARELRGARRVSHLRR